MGAARGFQAGVAPYPFESLRHVSGQIIQASLKILVMPVERDNHDHDHGQKPDHWGVFDKVVHDPQPLDEHLT